MDLCFIYNAGDGEKEQQHPFLLYQSLGDVTADFLHPL